MEGSVIVCKMRCSSVTQSKDAAGIPISEGVRLDAVYGPEGSENAEWSKWTPSAGFNIQISNPNAFGKLKEGDEYFVDLTPAPKPAPAAPENQEATAAAAIPSDASTP